MLRLTIIRTTAKKKETLDPQKKVQHKDGEVFSPLPRLHQKCCTVWHIAQVRKTQSAARADSLAQCEALCCRLVKLSTLVECIATKQPGSKQLQLSWFFCSPPARPHAGAHLLTEGGKRCDLRSKWHFLMWFCSHDHARSLEQTSSLADRPLLCHGHRGWIETLGWSRKTSQAPIQSLYHQSSCLLSHSCGHCASPGEAWGSEWLLLRWAYLGDGCSTTAEAKQWKLVLKSLMSLFWNYIIFAVFSGHSWGNCLLYKCYFYIR